MSEGRVSVGGKSRTDWKSIKEESRHWIPPPIQNSYSLLSRKAEADKFWISDIRPAKNRQQVLLLYQGNQVKIDTLTGTTSMYYPLLRLKLLAPKLISSRQKFL